MPDCAARNKFVEKKENDLHPDRNQNRITPFFFFLFSLLEKEKKQVLNYHVDFSLDSLCEVFGLGFPRPVELLCRVKNLLSI